MSKKLDESGIVLSSEIKSSISDKFGTFMREGLNTALKPVDLGVYANKIRVKFHNNAIIFDEFDSYEANKLVGIKLASDIYFYRRESQKNEPIKKDLALTSTNAGLGEVYDIVSTNAYNNLVQPIKTVDKKTEADRDKDRETYIKSAE